MQPEDYHLQHPPMLLLVPMMMCSFWTLKGILQIGEVYWLRAVAVDCVAEVDDAAEISLCLPFAHSSL